MGSTALPRPAGDPLRRKPLAARLRRLWSRLCLLPLVRRALAAAAALCLLLAAAAALRGRLRVDDPFAALVALPLPDVHTNSSLSNSRGRAAVVPGRIIVLVPADFPVFSLLLQKLTSAEYAPHVVALDVLLAPVSGPVDARARVAAAHTWPHGPYSVRSASSAGRFDMILDAWAPARGDDSRVIIFDAATSNVTLPGVDWFRALEQHISGRQAADVAGFALEPGKIRHEARVGGGLVDQEVSTPKDGVEDDAAYAYQALTTGAGRVFMPANAEVWRAFRGWFSARRAEWFLWPVVSEAKDKKDPVWDAFRGTTRAHWTAWFTRFCAEYELYTVYPRTSVLTSLSRLDGAAQGRLALRVPRYDYAGRAVSRKLAVSDASLARIVDLAWREGRGGTVSMTVVSQSFIATARSWICNVDVAGFRPPGVVWIAVDEASRDAMADVPDSETVYLSELGGGREEAGTSYGTPGYWLLMLERTKLIRELLELGVGVFAFETDQIWLRDPVPYVERLVHGGDDVDVVGTLDTRHEIGGNFLYLNPTLSTRRLWREVSTRFERAFQASKMDGRKAISSKQPKWKYIENDQSLLTRLTLFDESLRGRGNAAVFRALDVDLFADGRWYGEGDDKDAKSFYQSPKARSPVLVNNNFVIGIEKKMERARRHGHWFLDDSNMRCVPETVLAAVAANEQRARAEFGANGVENSGDLETSLDFAIAAIARERAAIHL